MSAQPQSYSIIFDAYVDYADAQVEVGYGITKNTSGSGFVAASTANLAVSHSGVFHGVAITTGPLGQTFQYQCDGIVGAAFLPFVGAGIIESAVLASDGKIRRASAASGLVIGQADKEGNVALTSAGGVLANLVGDVTGNPLANTVEKILNATVPALAGGVGKALVYAGALAFAWSVIGTASSGYDTADHGGGGQEVLSASGTGGVFNVRGSTALSFNTTPSTVGTIRTPWGGAWTARNHGNTLDLLVAGTNWDGARDLVAVGDANADLYLIGAAFNIALLNALPGPAIYGAAGAAVPVYLGADGSATTIRTATGAPVAADNNGSVYFRRDASTNADFAYGRIGGSWVALGGSGSGVTWADDLVTSTNTHQYVSQITGTGNLCTVISGTSLRFTTTTCAIGLIRTANNVTVIGSRNAAGSGDLTVLQVTSADGIKLGGALVTVTPGILEIGTSVATAGALRFANNAGIKFRNGAGSGNVDTLNIDGSNNLLVGGAGTAGAFMDGVTGANLRVNGADVLSCSASQITASQFLSMGSYYITFGATPAGTGVLRLSNNTGAYGRNAGNSADVRMLTLGGGDDIHVGDTGTAASVNLDVKSGGNIALTVANVQYMGVTSTLATIQATNLALGSLSPNFNSGTNVFYQATAGAAPNAKPSGGGYWWMDGGCPAFWGGNTPGSGVEVKLIFLNVNNPTLASSDYSIGVKVKDPGGGADLTRFIELKPLAGG